MAEALLGRRPPSRLQVAALCGVVFVAMLALAYAAVPLYRAFCQATGFDGTPRRVASGPQSKALAQTLSVRFDSNVRGGLPWRFRPVTNEMSVKIGATSMAYFTMQNLADHPVTGRATYNISPESAAPYFLKLKCFCFSDQTLLAKETKTFPVVFYVDPKFASDPDTQPLSELTLSYSYYPAPGAKASAPAPGLARP